MCSATHKYSILKSYYILQHFFFDDDKFYFTAMMLLRSQAQMHHMIQQTQSIPQHMFLQLFVQHSVIIQ